MPLTSISLLQALVILTCMHAGVPRCCGRAISTSREKTRTFTSATPVCQAFGCAPPARRIAELRRDACACRITRIHRTLTRLWNIYVGAAPRGKIRRRARSLAGCGRHTSATRAHEPGDCTRRSRQRGCAGNGRGCGVVCANARRARRGRVVSCALVSKVVDAVS